MVEGFSSLNPLLDRKEAKEVLNAGKSPAQITCEESGGRWDKATRTCKAQNPAGGAGTSPEEDARIQAQAAQETQDARGFEILRNAETGRLTGFKRGDQQLLGLPPSEVKALAGKEASLQEVPVGGAAEASLAGRVERLQSEGLDLSAQVGNDPISQLEQQFSAQNVNYVAALASGLPGIIPDLLTGAATGFGISKVAGAAATSTGVGAPAAVAGVTATTIGVAIANGIRGFYSDFVADVSRQKGELIETPIRTLTETKSIMNDIIGAQNANPADAASNLEAFNQQLQLLDNEFDRLKDLTDDDINKFLGENGINQMQEYEVYYVQGGERDQQISEMRVAFANPDPSRVTASTVTLEQIKERIRDELAKVQ